MCEAHLMIASMAGLMKLLAKVVKAGQAAEQAYAIKAKYSKAASK